MLFDEMIGWKEPKYGAKRSIPDALAATIKHYECKAKDMEKSYKKKRAEGRDILDKFRKAEAALRAKPNPDLEGALEIMIPDEFLHEPAPKEPGESEGEDD